MVLCLSNKPRGCKDDEGIAMNTFLKPFALHVDRSRYTVQGLKYQGWLKLLPITCPVIVTTQILIFFRVPQAFNSGMK